MVRIEHLIIILSLISHRNPILFKYFSLCSYWWDHILFIETWRHNRNDIWGSLCDINDGTVLNIHRANLQWILFRAIWSFWENCLCMQWYFMHVHYLSIYLQHHDVYKKIISTLWSVTLSLIYVLYIYVLAMLIHKVWLRCGKHILLVWILNGMVVVPSYHFWIHLKWRCQSFLVWLRWILALL